MVTETHDQFRFPMAWVGAIVLSAVALIFTTIVVMGGVAFLAPLPLVLFGVPAIALFLRGRRDPGSVPVSEQVPREEIVEGAHADSSSAPSP